MEWISYEGEPAAVVRGDRAYLMAAVEAGDPGVRDFVLMLAAYALDPARITDGDPFDQAEAEFVARWLLMPDAAFAPLAHLPDTHLADLFGVPVAEVARKRDDLLGPTPLAGECL